MVTFRQTLQEGLVTLCKNTVGRNTHNKYYVKTFDTYLHDIEIEEYPFVVVTVRQSEDQGQAELTTYRELSTWQVHIYYIDIYEESNPYPEGDKKRDHILERIEEKVALDRRLGNIEHTTSNGVREYVYDSRVTNILWDSSGQDGYYAFVSELYLSVDTAKT